MNFYMVRKVAFDERWKASYWLFFSSFSCFSEFCSLVIVLFTAGDQISFVTKQKAQQRIGGGGAGGGEGRLFSCIFCLTLLLLPRYDTIRRTVLEKGHGSVPAKAELASNGADREKHTAVNNPQEK